MDFTVEEIQPLLDAGMGVTGLAREYNVHHQEMARFIKRNGLEIYTPFDEMKRSDIRIKASLSELESAFHIDDNFKVIMDKEFLLGLRNIKDVKNEELREVKDSFELEAISCFVSSCELDEINVAKLKEFRHIESYIYKHYTTSDHFRNCHDISSDLVYYSSSKGRSFCIKLGVDFEELVRDSLSGIYGKSLAPLTTINNCRPDFIINGEWYDAKLSKSTALSASDDTISKYLSHTDKLTIIYAFDDGADTSSVESKYNVEFKHISEFYEKLSAEAIDEFETFIKRVSTIKGASI